MTALRYGHHNESNLFSCGTSILNNLLPHAAASGRKRPAVLHSSHVLPAATSDDGRIKRSLVLVLGAWEERLSAKHDLAPEAVAASARLADGAAAVPAKSLTKQVYLSAAFITVKAISPERLGVKRREEIKVHAVERRLRRSRRSDASSDQMCNPLSDTICV